MLGDQILATKIVGEDPVVVFENVPDEENLTVTIHDSHQEHEEACGEDGCR